jgi:hypothetical protein
MGQGYRVKVQEFGGLGSGFRVQGVRFRVKGVGFWVLDLGILVKTLDPKF